MDKLKKAGNVVVATGAKTMLKVRAYVVTTVYILRLRILVVFRATG
jgi:hypothetical protein